MFNKYLLGFELPPVVLPSCELPREVPLEPPFFESVSLARSSISLPIVSSHSSWSMSLTAIDKQKYVNSNYFAMHTSF